jgi:hypothetical protein
LQVIRFALVFSGEAKIAQFDIVVLVEEDILQLQVAVDTRFAVYVGDGTNELGKDFLDGLNGKGAVLA